MRLDEPLALFSQADALAALVRAGGQGQIALRLELFERGVDRLLRLDEKFADLRLREGLLLHPQRVEDPERAFGDAAAFRGAAVHVVELLRLPVESDEHLVGIAVHADSSISVRNRTFAV